jgi:tRNA-modifying protein YgfZ
VVLCCAILDDIPGQSRALVRLRGPDARRFLQGSVSGDVDALVPGRAVTAALLTLKGKLVAELLLLPASTDAYDVLVPAELADAVAESFEHHIVMDDVVVERVTDISTAIVWDDEGDEIAITGVDVRQVATRHPLPATLVVGPSAALRAALAGASAVDAAEFDRARIESATPGWGAELRPGFFPPEIGFVYAVSYDKGCYMGQEPLARIHARGQVNRVMVRVVLDRPVAVPTPLSAEIREDAGTLTTCVGELAGAGGLAIVRRELAVLGTLLRTGGDVPVGVRVISGPLGDDPGIAKATA